MLPKKGKKLHGEGWGEGDGCKVSAAVAAALREELGSTHQAVKTAMRWTGASERTVKHWLAGTYAPSGKHLVALMRHSDAVMMTVLSLTNRNTFFVGAALHTVRSKMLEIIDLIDTHHAESEAAEKTPADPWAFVLPAVTNT